MGIQLRDYISKKWNVGGGIRFFEEITAFNRFMEDFYGLEGPVICSVYDSHAGLKWNGGRLIPHFPFSLEESVRRIRTYNGMGISFNITFSNNQLTEADLQDEDCNWFLEQCESGLNAVIVGSHALKDHIRKRYPSYRVIASIGFNRKDLAFYQETLKEYDLVVLHPDLNRSMELIQQLDASKLEILVNEFCIGNCQFRTQHSTFISRLNREPVSYFRSDHSFMNGSCIAADHGLRFNRELQLSMEEVNRLNACGVRHFKIQGREHDFEQVVKKALHTYVLQGTIRELLTHLK